MITLSNLSPAPGSRRSPKRLGRGPGSGLGKTSGRGMKGQRARTSGNVRMGFEGGQMPLARRLPKRGFTNIFKQDVAIINVGQLSCFAAGSVVDEAALRSERLVRGSVELIKILGEGELDRSLTVKVHRISESARQKIEQAGGNVEVIGG